MLVKCLTVCFTSELLPSGFLPPIKPCVAWRHDVVIIDVSLDTSRCGTGRWWCEHRWWLVDHPQCVIGHVEPEMCVDQCGAEMVVIREWQGFGPILFKIQFKILKKI